MISFQEAEDILYSQEYPAQVETIQLEEAFGRFLAEPPASAVDSPPFDKSAMDGYAVMEGDASTELRILETVAAGETPTVALKAGHCTKIMTGAMVPEGAGKIVRVEYTEEQDGVMRITQPEPYENIIHRGENLHKGDTFMPRKRLGAGDIGSLAASGIAELQVFRTLKVGIVTTGSELRNPGEALNPGEIYDSNGRQLRCQILAAGAAPVSYGIIADDRDLHRRTLERALDECDLVILSGGVSKGEYDYVPGTLEELGVNIRFHGVLVKPGRPTLFGRRDDTFVFGLPGNPVSTYILFEVLVKPFIHHLNGLTFKPAGTVGMLEVSIRRRDTERMEFRPVRIIPDAPEQGLPLFRPVRYMGSAHLNAMVETEALVILPPGTGELKIGQLVHARLI